MTAQELWNAYQGETANVAPNNDNNNQNNNPETALPYAAWAFGGLTVEDTNILAELVRTGAKTATAGAYDSYVAEGCPLPKVGEYNIILDTGDNAVCITKTTAVTTMPFCEVSAEHARKEGEGDCSLAYWREVHQAFFTTELTAIHKSFSITMPVVCEEFKVVFTAPKGDNCNK